jgi:hypothetical protein
LIIVWLSYIDDCKYSLNEHLCVSEINCNDSIQVIVYI